jgi:hypothetical protein
MVLTRPLANVGAVALLVLVFLAVLPDRAHACSMATPTVSPQELALRYLDQATVVFSGEVLDVEGPVTYEVTERAKGDTFTYLEDTSIVTLRISEVWKGPQRETLEVMEDTDCGAILKEGQKYLVYAHASEKGKPFGVWAGTKPLSEAGADLKAFADLESMGGALVDTSGGFLGLWIIGMMGLAMAAVSSVVLVRLLRTS